jgi:HSP20 family molecular chaperone IbpA
MTLLVTRPRRSLAMFPTLGLPVTAGAPVDIEETAEGFVVEFDVPGAAPEDIQIELRDSEIRVFGTFEERGREGTLRHRARRTGEFEYLVALPGDVEADAVEAELDRGVLTIVAPKARVQQARRIEVQGRAPAAVPAASPEPAQVRNPDDSGTQQLRSPDNPAAHAKQMKQGPSRPAGIGSTGQVGRSSMG